MKAFSVRMSVVVQMERRCNVDQVGTDWAGGVVRCRAAHGVSSIPYSRNVHTILDAATEVRLIRYAHTHTQMTVDSNREADDRVSSTPAECLATLAAVREFCDHMSLCCQMESWGMGNMTRMIHNWLISVNNPGHSLVYRAV